MDQIYSSEEKVLIENLKKEFPENIIYSVSKCKLYDDIYYLSKKREMKPKEYIKYLGFKSKVNKDSIDNEEELRDELIKIYPDRNVIKLSSYDIYQDVLKFAKRKKVSTKDYLKNLGFSYMQKKDVDYSEEEIVLELKNILTNNEYISLSVISNADFNLYNTIKLNAKLKKIKTEEYLKGLGFVKTGKKSNDIQDSFDAYSLNRIINSYDIPGKKIAELLSCTPENIYRQIRNEISDKNKGGWEKELSYDETKEVIKLINEKKYKKIEGNNAILILSNKKEFENKAIFYKNGNKVKCVFNLPIEITKSLQENFFDILSERDFKDLQIMYRLWKEQGAIINGKNKVINIDTGFCSRLRAVSANKNMKIDEYLDLLDFERVNNRYVVTDESLIRRIEKYIVKDNIVRIKFKDKDYAYLAAIACRKKFGGIEGLINHYGYIYEKVRDTSNIIQEHINTIRERYIIEGKDIYKFL